MITAVAGVLVSLFTWNGIENSLVSHLFKRKVRANKPRPLGAEPPRSTLNANELNTFMEIWRDCTPSCGKSKTKSLNSRIFK